MAENTMYKDDLHDITIDTYHLLYFITRNVLVDSQAQFDKVQLLPISIMIFLNQL